MQTVASISLAWAMLTLAAGVQAQAFGNLDFEGATVESNDPVFGFLVWDLAVPQWAHGGGSDSGVVYQGSHHVGLTPWYQLVDASAPGLSPLQGRYSLALANGHVDAQSEQSAWIESFIAQSGHVASSVRSVRFAALGQVELRVNGVAQVLHALGGNQYAADITAYAGQTVALSFVNKSTALHDPVVLDAISLSPIAVVPEPGTLAMVLVGLGIAGYQARRRSPHA